jgi:hypothetical protein
MIFYSAWLQTLSGQHFLTNDTPTRRLSAVTKTSAKPKHMYLFSYFLDLHLLLSARPPESPFLAFILKQAQSFKFEWLKI